MKEYLSSVSSKGQITVPAELRNRLGRKPRDKVAFFIADDGVLLKPAAADLKAGFQAIPALKPSRSLEQMTEIAAEEHAH